MSSLSVVPSLSIADTVPAKIIKLSTVEPVITEIVCYRQFDCRRNFTLFGTNQLVEKQIETRPYLGMSQWRSGLEL